MNGHAGAQSNAPGTFVFPNLCVRLRPKAGMLVAFPSDHRFLHGVEPVTSGERYAIAGWAAALGVPKVGPRPPPDRRR